MMEPIDILLRGADTGGHLAAIEMTVAAGGTGPPLHLHPSHGEGFYVLTGQLILRVGDDLMRARPGTFAFAPAGMPHTFTNTGDRDARMLVLLAPAGFERYFEALARGSQERPPPEDAVRVGPPISAADQPPDLA